MKKTKAIKEIQCGSCGNEINADGCKKCNHEFDEREEIYCNYTSGPGYLHYHIKCIEEEE